MRTVRALAALAALVAAGGAGERAPPPPRADPDDDDDALPELEDALGGAGDDGAGVNGTQRGMYVGAVCEFTCDQRLRHVYCDPVTARCECEAKYPVRLGPDQGCAKPKKLGEQCFYRQTCKFADAHASCVQIGHNAICRCDAGYHSVSYARPVKRVFCTEDMALLTADVPTLLGVASGIAVLAGLLCMVLHLYTRARYPRPAHLADASLTPPILYALSETGLPLSRCGARGSRPSSRPSSRSSQTTAGSLDAERRGRGVPVSASRAGSRRPSVASSSGSVRSYSARRFEREREQRERRQLARAASTTPPPRPLPRSPDNSTDGLLPALNEGRELSLSAIVAMDDVSLQGIVGPCSSASTSTQY